MYLAQNLIYLRKQKGITQNEFAEIVGKERSTIAGWETGEKEPRLNTLIHIADYFGVTLDDLVLKDLKPPLPLYASNIKYLRKRQEITQEDMAVFFEFSGKSSLCAVETGESGISIENLEKIADFFGVTLDQIVKHDLSKEGV